MSTVDRSRHGAHVAGRDVDPLDELQGDGLRTLEEAELPADVVHLLAQQLHSVRDEASGRLFDVIHTEGEVVVAPAPQVRRGLLGSLRWHRVELQELDLEAGLAALEHERDVLGLHVRHAHVPRRRATVDRRDVALLEAEELEELDRGHGVGHRDGHVVGVAHHGSGP